MNRRSINTQEELNDLLRGIDWEDAFVREVYLVSPSYITNDNSIVAPMTPPDLLPTVKILIASPSDDYPGVELTLEDVQTLCVPFGIYYEPIGWIDRGDFVISFSGSTV